ncbi:MAG: undecaprenyl-diphosphate phosphatase [Proteobacteria bacterium]|nr:undecaprenyl-diphosphate phosphatase [Pseudomonadota bacterium]
MDLLQIFILAIIQGAAELLPVSSSAHVIAAEKLMGLDPTAPQMTLLLVMLHTGTMFAVIVYFWRSWWATYFDSVKAFRVNALHVAVATAATGVVGLALLQALKHLVAGGDPAFEVEHLFGNAKLMAAALAAAGVLIIVSSRLTTTRQEEVSLRSAAWIGAVQGLCLPFRGFSRSGATISTGLALGVARRRSEEFSFALAVVLTPAVIVKEAYRLYHAHALAATGAPAFWQLLWPSLLGMGLSFVAGLLALRWLSRWLEQGRWHVFGAYCLVASIVVLWIG